MDAPVDLEALAREARAVTIRALAGNADLVDAFHDAPIFVMPEMLALPIVIDAPTAVPQLEDCTERKRVEQSQAPDVPAMEWRSFRTLPDPRG